MCKPLSLISSGDGKVYYITAEQRKTEMKDKHDQPITNPDSHTSIAAYFRLDEDVHNKWEYGIFDEKLVLDQQNTADDREAVMKVIDAIPKEDWRSMYGDIFSVRALVQEAKTIKWFERHGECPECVKMYDTLAAARDAARDAAGDAALLACVHICDGLALDQKHIDHAKLRWSIWQAGYGVLCDVDGALFCYRKVV